MEEWKDSNSPSTDCHPLAVGCVEDLTAYTTSAYDPHHAREQTSDEQQVFFIQESPRPPWYHSPFPARSPRDAIHSFAVELADHSGRVVRVGFELEENGVDGTVVVG